MIILPVNHLTCQSSYLSFILPVKSSCLSIILPVNHLSCQSSCLSIISPVSHLTCQSSCLSIILPVNHLSCQSSQPVSHLTCHSSCLSIISPVNHLTCKSSYLSIILPVNHRTCWLSRLPFILITRLIETLVCCLQGSTTGSMNNAWSALIVLNAQDTAVRASTVGEQTGTPDSEYLLLPSGDWFMILCCHLGIDL